MGACEVVTNSRVISPIDMTRFSDSSLRSTVRYALHQPAPCEHPNARTNLKSNCKNSNKISFELSSEVLMNYPLFLSLFACCCWLLVICFWNTVQPLEERNLEILQKICFIILPKVSRGDSRLRFLELCFKYLLLCISIISQILFCSLFYLLNWMIKEPQVPR